MPLVPKIPSINAQSSLKRCARCDVLQDTKDFAHTNNLFYPDHLLPYCNACITDFLRQREFSWDSIDKVCQWADIPFIVREWERIKDLNSEDEVWGVYARVFAADTYKSIGWADYFKQYQKLRETGLIDDELPLLHEKKIKELQKQWGANYSEDELYYLEDLYKGLLTTQNVNGALQDDQARKICKLSYEIDVRIRNGDKDVDKFLSSYEKLVKAAEFTPKNTRNAADFDSFAELGMWLEKRGRQNHFYDGVTRDIVDETLKNIENYNQRLYINEGGLGDEITQRLQSLKLVNSAEEKVYDTQQEFDLEEYDNNGFLAEDESEFNVEGDDE